MHAIQTSGNCIRNTPPRPVRRHRARRGRRPAPYCELIRAVVHAPPRVRLPAAQVQDRGQWRAKSDRAAIAVHDIGVQLVAMRRARWFVDLVGGGLGPHAGHRHADSRFLPGGICWATSRPSCGSTTAGRRDNKYKARIKILVKALGAEEFTRLVEAQWNGLRDGAITLTREAESSGCRASSLRQPMQRWPTQCRAGGPGSSPAGFRPLAGAQCHAAQAARLPA
jgi:sulfite reductase (NADPH) hemoprotein beta-component